MRLEYARVFLQTPVPLPEDPPPEEDYPEYQKRPC
jgi:hypothetical protein